MEIFALIIVGVVLLVLAEKIYRMEKDRRIDLIDLEDRLLDALKPKPKAHGMYDEPPFQGQKIPEKAALIKEKIKGIPLTPIKRVRGPKKISDKEMAARLKKSEEMKARWAKIREQADNQPTPMKVISG